MIIRKKCWPEYFEKVLSGEKKFEVRLDDFYCGVGDVFVLEEYNPETQQYTGRTIRKKIAYIVKTKDFEFWDNSDVEKYGYQIMSLEDER